MESLLAKIQAHVMTRATMVRLDFGERVGDEILAYAEAPAEPAGLAPGYPHTGSAATGSDRRPWPARVLGGRRSALRGGRALLHTRLAGAVPVPAPPSSACSWPAVR